jgi:hypothetical protein
MHVPARPSLRRGQSHEITRDERTFRDNGSGAGRDLLDVAPPNIDRASGKKELLVVRIESPEGSTSLSEDQLFNDIFDDDINVAKQYSACSHGKLKLTPAQGPSIRNGIATVILSGGESPGVARTAEDIFTHLDEASPSLFGRSLESFDHVMLCVPKGTRVEAGDGSTTTQWFAYVPGKQPYTNFLSVFHDEWCSSVSTGMHEIGHTLGLHHSNEAGSEYEDMSGQMGYSSDSEHGPLKCFNPPNSWHLGWYSENSLRLNPLLDAPFKVTLAGAVDSGENNEANVLVQIPNGQTNIFLGYNRAKDFNAETSEGQNRVMVHEQSAGGDQMTSLLAKLGTRESYKFPNYSGSGKDLVIEVTGKTPKQKEAIVDVYFEQDESEGEHPSVTINGCPENQVRFEVTLITDAYSSDSSWELVRTTGDHPTVVAEQAPDTLVDYQTHDELICIDKGETYEFTFRDSYGDGICCRAGFGSYSVFINGKEIVRGGEFGSNGSEGEKVFSVSHIITTGPADEDDNEDCRDDPEFRYAGKKKCGWIANHPENRCIKTWEGKPVSEYCPVTCGTCHEEPPPPSDNDGGVGDEDGDGDNFCSDDPSFAFKGKDQWNCSWAAEKLKKRCTKTPIAKACPITCGTCSSGTE